MSSASKACALAALWVACAGCSSQVTEPDVDVAPPLIETNVGPIPGVGEPPPEPLANPFANDLSALAEGRRFFEQYNCSGCHGDHGGGGMGPSLRDEAWLYGNNHAQIANSIVEGRAYGMPAWGTWLTRTQVWQITAYIKSMRTEHEPDKPQ